MSSYGPKTAFGVGMIHGDRRRDRHPGAADRGGRRRSQRRPRDPDAVRLRARPADVELRDRRPDVGRVRREPDPRAASTSAVGLVAGLFSLVLGTIFLFVSRRDPPGHGLDPAVLASAGSRGGRPRSAGRRVGAGAATVGASPAGGTGQDHDDVRQPDDERRDLGCRGVAEDRAAGIGRADLPPVGLMRAGPPDRSNTVCVPNVMTPISMSSWTALDKSPAAMKIKRDAGPAEERREVQSARPVVEADAEHGGDREPDEGADQDPARHRRRTLRPPGRRGRARSRALRGSRR